MWCTSSDDSMVSSVDKEMTLSPREGGREYGRSSPSAIHDDRDGDV